MRARGLLLESLVGVDVVTHDDCSSLSRPTLGCCCCCCCMTTTSSHSTRRTAAATLRATLTTRRTWALMFGHAMYYHLKCPFPCGNLGHGSRLSSHPKQQLDRLFSHFRNNVQLLQCKTLNFISPQLQP